MEINLGEQRIVHLRGVYSSEQIQALALNRRIDAFGQMAKLIQRPKPEDIDIVTTQKRLEPFWYACAVARYVYERRNLYHFEVAPEVQSVAIHGEEHPASADKLHRIEIEGVEHIHQDFRQEITLEGVSGNDADYRRYISSPQEVVPDIKALEGDNVVLTMPEVRSSFVVRKLVPLLMKSFHADRVLEEHIDVEQTTLFFRPVYAVEYMWKAKGKQQVLEFDAVTGEHRSTGEIKRQIVRVLENDALFDIGADALGTLVPGANIAVKLGRMAARKAIN